MLMRHYAGARFKVETSGGSAQEEDDDFEGGERRKTDKKPASVHQPTGAGSGAVPRVGFSHELAPSLALVSGARDLHGPVSPVCNCSN